MNSPFFSIIVPVYNVKNYLGECLDSIIAQDFMDYEILLIDDGSTDGSELICDEFASNHTICKVFHQMNGGLSQARNTGLSQARGAYIWFIDSDDYLLCRTAFREVFELIKQENVDVVLFSYKKYYDQTSSYSGSMISKVLSNCEELIKTNAYKALGCNKVVKLTLIDKYAMRFPVGLFGEDLSWCADLLAYAGNSMALCANNLLAYRQRDGSITNNKNKLSRKKHIKDTLFLINESINKYSVGTDISYENNLIGHYLAYEFSWLLGEAYPYWEEFSSEVNGLSFLLNYNLSRKVSKVAGIKRIFGIKGASLILYLFIKLKKYVEV